MSEPIIDAVENYISDDELDALYVEPAEGEEETHNEELLDSLAALASIKEENYLEDDSVLESEA